MNLGRVVYVVILVASIGSAAFFGYSYFLKDRELKEYQNLAQLSCQALKRTSAELEKTKKELILAQTDLELAQQEATSLNSKIAVLEQDKEKYQEELSLLREQRKTLQSKINVLELKTLALEERFQSLEELERAIIAVKREKSGRMRLARIEMLERLDEMALRQGNRGFLVKNGETTFKPTRIRVQLEPANMSFSESK